MTSTVGSCGTRSDPGCWPDPNGIGEGEFSGISVVIPFGGGSLAQLLDQLKSVVVAARCASVSGLDSCEIVLAVNVVGAVQRVESVISDSGIRMPVKVVDASGLRGPSHARNVGVRHASGSLILFCDSDDVVDEHWIIRMVEALKGGDLVGGAIDLSLLNRGSRSKGSRMHLPREDWNWLRCASTANLGVRRGVFDGVGGFDETISLGEDKDFCWRAQYSGAEFVVAPTAIVHYRWRSTLREHFSQTFCWGVGDAVLVRKHAEFGWKPQYIGGLWRTIRASLYLSAVPLLWSRRWNAVGAFGKAAGRVIGSMRFGIWAL